VARQEQDREDILKEASALVQRIEIELPDLTDNMIAGFRRDGSASLFVGPDPVFQFNSKHELRRAYQSGLLIKAERGQLVSLQRRRAANQVQLLRSELNEAATAELITAAASYLQLLDSHLRNGTFTIHGQVPHDVDVVGRVRKWLADRPRSIRVAARPHAG